MTRTVISTPSSGTRPLGSVESAKVGQRGPHTIKLGVLIHSDPLRKARLGAKGTAVAGGNRGGKWGSESDPTPRISTFEPRQIPPNPRPRCLDPNSGSVPPSAAHGPIHKTPNDSLNKTNPSSELPQSEAQDPRLTIVISEANHKPPDQEPEPQAHDRSQGGTKTLFYTRPEPGPPPHTKPDPALRTPAPGHGSAPPIPI